MELSGGVAAAAGVSVDSSVPLELLSAGGAAFSVGAGAGVASVDFGVSAGLAVSAGAGVSEFDVGAALVIGAVEGCAALFGSGVEGWGVGCAVG